MKLLDTNLIIRFLLKDHLIQSPLAKKLIEDPSEELIVTDVSFAEVVWLLKSFYHFPKEQIVEKLYSLLDLQSIRSNRSVLIRTLYFYLDFSVDFIDAYLTAYSEIEKLEGIYSFDKGLDKIKEVKRFKP